MPCEDLAARARYVTALICDSGRAQPEQLWFVSTCCRDRGGGTQRQTFIDKSRVVTREPPGSNARCPGEEEESNNSDALRGRISRR